VADDDAPRTRAAAAPTVYVASPLGYTLAGRIFSRRTLVPALLANDLAVRDPWQDDEPRLDAAVTGLDGVTGHASADRGSALAARNAEWLRDADVVLAILDGPAPDPGVAVEVGVASALGIPVIGWRSDVRGGGHVVPAALRHAIEASGGSLHASLGDAVSAVVTVARRRPGRRPTT
jgi:nucleoside 2-deoxyribosyltransferase